jgi:hypothetical protein
VPDIWWRDLEVSKFLNCLFEANNELFEVCLIFVLNLGVCLNCIKVEHSTSPFILRL